MTAAELAELHRRAIELPRPWSSDEFSALLEMPHVHLSTAQTAFALGRTIAGESELLTLATDPATRRRGLARRVLAAFEAEARARGAAEAFLEVATGNAPAIALYTSADWARSGLRRGYYATDDGGSVDALIMRKSLAPT